MPKDPATQVEELKARLKVVSETNLSLKGKVASLTSKSDARYEFQAKYEELRRHYQLSGLGKKVDISTLPDFAPIARRLMDEGRIGMHFDRLYTLWQAVTAAPDAPAVAEVGSYKGGSSKFIAETLKALGRSPRFYVCDTFAGHARVDREIDGVSDDDGFKDTSAESVAAYLGDYPNVQIVVGDIFESSAQLAGETAFGFVHIDVDVYPPTAFCLDFFSTRLAPGAWMVVDDYGVVTCPGAQKAVDDFVRDHPTFSKVHLLTGQALVFEPGEAMRLPVLFDGGCPLCRRTVRIIRALDWNDRLQFVDATNAEARAFFAPSLTEAQMMVEMYVVDERQRLHGGFEGFLQISRVVPVMWPFGLIARLPGIRQIGHAVYKIVAANRVRRGRCTDALCAPGLVGSKGSGGSGGSKGPVQ